MESINRATNGILELVKKKDHDLYAHSLNVSRFAAYLASEVGLDKTSVELISLAGKVHDIGKISIPESILYKRGAFVEAEYRIMANHPVYSAAYLLINNGIEPECAEELLLDVILCGGDAIRGVNKELDRCITAVLFHHEKQNGSGYPCGLKGENIPLEAAIICLADFYVAMCEKRPYRDGHTKDYALETIKKHSGSFFIPSIVKKLPMTLHKHPMFFIEDINENHR